MNLIQLLTDQRAYEGITHSRAGASWNWRCKRFGDDEDKKSPSPEPKTDSRSGLPMKNMRWRRIRIAKQVILPHWFFSRKIGIYGVGFRVCGATRWGQPTWACQEGAHPGGLCPPRCPPSVVLGSRNSLLLYKKSFKSFIPFWELLFLHKKQHHGSSIKNIVSLC